MARHLYCRFLESITRPCEALALAKPKEIPSILPGLLNCIRMIWSLSKFYNTEECLTGLLRKISNEIINRCCAKISLSDIFDGDVEGACGARCFFIHARRPVGDHVCVCSGQPVF